MKNKNEGLLVALCLFFVIFLAPFNLMMALLLALALLTAYFAFRMMSPKRPVRRTSAKKSGTRTKGRKKRTK